MKRHSPEELEDVGPLFATPKARASDPHTSHAAADALTRESVGRLRVIVMDALLNRSMDDHELVACVLHGHPQYSPSGVRTRRSELVQDGRVRDSGRLRRLPSGRSAIIWEALR